MNKFHIALVHDTILPAKHYGGTERVVWWLAKGLKKLGHEVTLIVPKGSSSEFFNIISREKGSSIEALLPKDVHLVHASYTLKEEISKPLLITIHGNGKPGECFHHNTIFLTKNHALRHGAETYVYNGIDPDDYPKSITEKKEPYCYFLAKAKWKVKNAKGAIKIAKHCSMPIKILGGWRPSLNKNIKWYGMVGGSTKIDLLQKGSALLFPVRWHEPFGLAILEALVTGSPVFGTPYGSLPELISENFGFLSNNHITLSAALSKYKNFNPDDCRNHVLNNFTHLHMANNYLNLYEHVINGKSISKSEPHTISKISPETLLEFF